MKKIIVSALFMLLFIPIVSASSEKVKVTFSKCVDGDTAKVILNDKEITVRFLAIDTPETKHPTKGEEPFGKEASNYTCNELKKATKIELEYDGKDKTDKYDRHLAWMFVDNYLLQDKLIKKGYAEVAYLYDDYKYTSLLQEHETIAKLEKQGKWNDDTIQMENIIQIIIALISCIVIIILFITNKNYRTKVIRKLTNKVKKKISNL